MGTTSTTSNIVALKNTSYILAFIGTMEYLEITPISVVVLAILVLVDIVVGILKCGLMNGGCSIRSSVIERGVIAKLLLISIPLLIAFTGKGLGLSLTWLAQGAMSVFILAEVYSIIGNIYSIKTGKDEEEFDAISFALLKIRDGLKNIIVEDKSTIK